MNYTCPMCGSQMSEKGIKKIKEDTYYILFCEKCRHQCARSE